MKKTVNITLKLTEHELTDFESWLGQYYEMVSFKILPDTEFLYENNSAFKKLVKNVKDAQKVRDEFINNYNYEIDNS